MKELWACMIQIFSDNGKYIKRIKKSQRLEEYETAAAAVFRDWISWRVPDSARINGGIRYFLLLICSAVFPECLSGCFVKLRDDISCHCAIL